MPPTASLPTIFPSTVAASKDSPRFLVSGHNNPKLGKMVLKGPRTGWPIYQLSLEERATCPRSCEQWSTCYGNAMHLARRHTPDAEFLRYLIAEVTTLCRSHPEGLLLRLHTLGDFYSVEYVYVWGSLLSQFPQLHVFGYTARRIGDPDPETDRIARAIDVLTTNAWDRFAIRTSGTRSLARSRSIVVDADPQEPDVIVCPAQTEQTEACASCGLCWASSARDKTIAFLKHGMKTRGPAVPKAANDPEPVVAKPVRQATTVLADNPGELKTRDEAQAVARKVAPAPGLRSGQALDFLWREWVRQGVKYLEGDGVTWGGSFWIAQKDTATKPDGGEWRLAVKKGRDGKDGLAGERGEKGLPGPAGRDLTQIGADGSKW